MHMKWEFLMEVGTNGLYVENLISDPEVSLENELNIVEIRTIRVNNKSKIED